MTVLFFFSFLFHYIFPFRVIYLVLFIILGTVLLIRMGIRLRFYIWFVPYVRDFIFCSGLINSVFYDHGFIIITIHNIAGKGIKKIGIVSFVPSLSSLAIYFLISYTLLNVVYIRGIFVVSVCQGLCS